VPSQVGCTFDFFLKYRLNPVVAPPIMKRVELIGSGTIADP
jgi:hypothetical protein